MLSKKPHFENHKTQAGSMLAARLEILKSKGISDLQIKKDAKVKHYRAEIRKARSQLADIAKLEAQIVQKAETKAAKLAAPKIDHAKPKRSSSDQEKKRAKRERKHAAAEAEAEE